MNNQKPFEVAFAEFNRELASLVENCGLPPAVIGQSLQIVLTQVNRAAKHLYEQANSNYNNQENGGEQ